MVTEDKLIAACRESGPPELLAHIRKYAKAICRSYNTMAAAEAAGVDGEKAAKKATKAAAKADNGGQS